MLLVAYHISILTALWNIGSDFLKLSFAYISVLLVHKLQGIEPYHLHVLECLVFAWHCM